MDFIEYISSFTKVNKMEKIALNAALVEKKMTRGQMYIEQGDVCEAKPLLFLISRLRKMQR